MRVEREFGEYAVVVTRDGGATGCVCEMPEEGRAVWCDLAGRWVTPAMVRACRENTGVRSALRAGAVELDWRQVVGKTGVWWIDELAAARAAFDRWRAEVEEELGVVGAGDIIAMVTQGCGIDAAVKKVVANCRCGERRRALNEKLKIRLPQFMAKLVRRAKPDWCVAITCGPERSFGGLLEECIGSLALGGWHRSEIVVVAEPDANVDSVAALGVRVHRLKEPGGAWGTWMEAARVAAETANRWCMVVQDDVVVAGKAARIIAERAIDNGKCYMLARSGAYREIEMDDRGWAVVRGTSVPGSAWAIAAPPETMRRVAEWNMDWQSDRPAAKRKWVDAYVPQAVGELWVWRHSMAQHMSAALAAAGAIVGGRRVSTLGHRQRGDQMVAVNWPGLFADPEELRWVKDMVEKVPD